MNTSITQYIGLLVFAVPAIPCLFFNPEDRNCCHQGIYQLLDQFLDPEAEIKHQFLDQESDVMFDNYVAARL